MCFGGGPAKAILDTQKQEPDYKNAPVVVTGKQTGVKNPKDTKKATETLKIKRQKEEGIYVEPNLTTASTLERSTRRSGRRLNEQQQKGRDAARDRAKQMARARLKKKFGSSPTGKSTGIA